MGLLPQLRNLLAYPGGDAGFDATHPAAAGIRFSGVATSNGFQSLDAARKYTTNATVVYTQTSLGPTLVSTAANSNGGLAYQCPYSAQTAAVFGSIFTVSSSPPAAGGRVIQTGNNGLLATSAMGLLALIGSGNYTTGVTLSVGVPYFVAFSAVPAISKIYFVVANLATGSIRTGTIAGPASITSLNNTVAIAGTTSYALNGGVATAMHSLNNPLGLQALRAWAQDPWAFWYPPKRLSWLRRLTIVTQGTLATQSSTLGVSLASGKLAQPVSTTALALARGVSETKAVASSAALALARGVSETKAVASSAALATVRGVGKWAAVSATDAVGLARLTGTSVAASTTGAIAWVSAVARSVLLSTVPTVILSLASSVHAAATKAIAIAITSASTWRLGRDLTRHLQSSTGSMVARTRSASTSATLSASSAVTAWTPRIIPALVAFSHTGTAGLVKSIGKVAALSDTVLLALARGVAARMPPIASAGAATLTKGVSKPSAALSIASAVVTRTPRTVAAIFAMAVSGSASRAQRLIRLRAIAPIDLVLRTVGRRLKLELPGMSTKIDGTFHAGETWLIRGTACDECGNGLDLTGATVQLRITSGDAIVLDLATPAGGSIIDAPNGTYRFLISAAQQATMLLTSYDYEVRVTLVDMTVSVQNHGRIIVKPSKFVRFPPA